MSWLRPAAERDKADVAEATIALDAARAVRRSVMGRLVDKLERSLDDLAADLNNVPKGGQ